MRVICTTNPEFSFRRQALPATGSRPAIAGVHPLNGGWGAGEVPKKPGRGTLPTTTAKRTRLTAPARVRRVANFRPIDENV
jgi:hypothetical protein